MLKALTSLSVVILLAATTWAQTSLTVTVENLQPEGGLFFTPVWAGFHDGTFDVFDVGGMASSELEAIAEGGDTAPLSTLFAGNGVDGNVAPGSPFGPAGSSFGSSASAEFVVDPMSNGYFSYASMIIPSNDAFFGNDNPLGYPLFNGMGEFDGPVVIEILGSDIYDSGTELNDAMGAAFSTIGGTDTSEAMPIGMHAGLDNFIGTGTANGEMIDSAFMADTVIGRITITQTVPEPNAAMMLLLAVPAVGFLRGRRRKPRNA